ncbi:hypothetical protein A2U01_0070177, partial [Trifolium medium]|nr:hypothetical protein [Trifolium medium]
TLGRGTGKLPPHIPRPVDIPIIHHLIRNENPIKNLVVLYKCSLRLGDYAANH